MNSDDQPMNEGSTDNTGDCGNDACVCRGNWRELVREVKPLIGDRYKDEKGKVWRLTGLMHAEDDFWYCLTRKRRYKLLSCVTSIENYGFTSKHRDMVSAHAIRSIAVEAIREATGASDIKGKDGESLVDKLERLVLVEARKA